MKDLSKYLIEVIPNRCTGCLMCQLACSELHTKAFNPAAAYIRIDLKGLDCDISFTAECTGCGTCVEHCFYDALVKRPCEAKP